jgi:hypothetical protein
MRSHGAGALVAAAIVATVAAPARADITVNSANDFTAAGTCTLREALAAAAAPGNASPDCPGAAASGTTTITLAASPLLSAEIEIPGGVNVAIAGAGPGATAIAPNGSSRAFVIDSGATVSISGVTIAHFRAPDGGPGGSGTSATTRGGNGLNGGGGGIGGDGGAILNAGTLTLQNVHLDDNRAGAGGNGGTGGDGAEGVNATSMNGTNLPGGIGGHGGDGGNGGAGGGGGAISNSGTLTISASEFSSDSAGSGGDGATGGHGGDGGPTILNSNSTGGNGGNGGTGGVAGAGGSGGAIQNNGTLTMTNSTIDSALAGDAGRGGAGGVGGIGGDGYPSGFLTTTGGNGGAGGVAGPNGGDGGSGGAIANFLGTVTLTSVELNGAAGAGTHPNAPGRGGQAGFGDTEGVTGDGGAATTGGDGGKGGALLNFLGTATIDQSFIDGGAGAGGQASDGGEPGDTRLDGFRGGAPKHQTDGLPTAGGPGGDGGSGGALELEGHTTLTNTTVFNSSAGRGGAGGPGGAGHSHPGGAGGDGGNGASGGGIDAATTTGVLIAHDTIDFVSRGIGGDHGLGGSGSSTGASGSAGSAGAIGGIAKTSPTPATERNSIVDQASGTSCSAGITDGGHNLVYPMAGCPGTVADPGLPPETDRSDGIPVLPLGPTSPAIDQVPASGANCLASDERGAPRPQGAACDIGAYERGPAPVCPDVHRDVAFNDSTSLSLLCSSASTRPDAGTNALPSVVTQPSHGSAAQSGVPTITPTIGYASSHDFVGTDSFTYRETNSDGTSNTATVTVTVHVPAAPTFTGSTPGSPSTALSLHITGHSGDNVSLYASADCSGPAVATGDAATFASPGLVVTAAPNATTTISARYTIDGVASDCSTTPLTYVNDTAPPETTIDSGPSGTTADERPVFTFSANEPSSTFECSLDDGTANFRSCSGPGASDQPPNRLASGAWTFRVRATDPLGNQDPTPAISRFTVAPATGGPPNTILTKHPKRRLTVKSRKSKTRVTFRFRSSPAGATFTCKLDKGKAKVCRSPKRYKVKRGRHTFTVTAKNATGTDRTPARFRFTVSVRKRKHA